MVYLDRIRLLDGQPFDGNFILLFFLDLLACTAVCASTQILTPFVVLFGGAADVREIHETAWELADLCPASFKRGA